MQSSKFFIKSNYIKNTKDNWVLCEGKLLHHQNVAFLHLKSVNFMRDSAEIISDSDSNCSGFSTHSKMNRIRQEEKCIRLNVLCNLLEFKYCEIKPVKFSVVNKFAIKLVPSGFLSSKKLYLIPQNEESLTEWCGWLTGFISKKMSFPINKSSIDDQSSMTMSSTFRATETTERTNTLSKSTDIYISLDDNDAYEVSNQNEFYLVNIIPSEDSIKLHLQGNYLFKLGRDCLELLNSGTRDLIHTFPYSSIRRFGAKDSMLRVEAGRHCSTGNGSFTFHVKDAVQIAGKLKENARQFKNERSVHNSCMTLDRPPMFDATLQVEAGMDFTMNRFDSIDRASSVGLKVLNDEFQDEGSTHTIVEEMETNKTEILENEVLVQDMRDCSVDVVAEPLDVIVPNNVTGEFFAKEVLSDDLAVEEDECDNVREIDYTKEEVITPTKITSLSKRRHHDCNISDIDYLDYKSENLIYDATDKIEMELRPMSLFEVSDGRCSLQYPSSSSFSTNKTTTSPMLSDYKVSDSTFFKYRQLPKLPAQMLPSLSGQNLTTNFFRLPTLPVPMEIESPKKSPPPILPKPKFKLSENSSVYDQAGYREFDQMLKDLQISLDQ